MRDPETREAELLWHFVPKSALPVTEQVRREGHRADAGAVVRVDRNGVLVNVTRVDQLDAEVARVLPQRAAAIEIDVPVLVVADLLPELGDRGRRRKAPTRKRPGLLDHVRKAERRLGGGGPLGDGEQDGAQQQQRRCASDWSYHASPFDARQ